MKNYLKHKHHKVVCGNCGKLISKDYYDIDDPEWCSHFEDIAIEEYCDCNIPTYYWCETCNEDFQKVMKVMIVANMTGEICIICYSVGKGGTADVYVFSFPKEAIKDCQGARENEMPNLLLDELKRTYGYGSGQMKCPKCGYEDRFHPCWDDIEKEYCREDLAPNYVKDKVKKDGEYYSLEDGFTYRYRNGYYRRIRTEEFKARGNKFSRSKGHYNGSHIKKRRPPHPYKFLDLR